MNSSVSFDRGSDQLVHGGQSHKRMDSEQNISDSGNGFLMKVNTTEPFDEAAPSASKKNLEFTEVQEIFDDEESAKGL